MGAKPKSPKPPLEAEVALPIPKGGLPKVKTRAVRRRDGIWDLHITCPYCGKKHHHGGGEGNRPNLGSRAAHCSGTCGLYRTRGVLEYELVPGD